MQRSPQEAFVEFALTSQYQNADIEALGELQALNQATLPKLPTEANRRKRTRLAFEIAQRQTRIHQLEAELNGVDLAQFADLDLSAAASHASNTGKEKTSAGAEDRAGDFMVQVRKLMDDPKTKMAFELIKDRLKNPPPPTKP